MFRSSKAGKTSKAVSKVTRSVDYSRWRLIKVKQIIPEPTAQSAVPGEG